jgi:hypothetical protein
LFKNESIVGFKDKLGTAQTELVQGDEIQRIYVLEDFKGKKIDNFY